MTRNATRTTTVATSPLTAAEREVLLRNAGRLALVQIAGEIGRDPRSLIAALKQDAGLMTAYRKARAAYIDKWVAALEEIAARGHVPAIDLLLRHAARGGFGMPEKRRRGRRSGHDSLADWPRAIHLP